MGMTKEDILKEAEEEKAKEESQPETPAPKSEETNN